MGSPALWLCGLSCLSGPFPSPSRLRPQGLPGDLTAGPGKEDKPGGQLSRDLGWLLFMKFLRVSYSWALVWGGQALTCCGHNEAGRLSVGGNHPTMSFSCPMSQGSNYT